MSLPDHWPPAPPGKPEPSARRVYISKLMSRHLWRKGESAGLLAAHWGLGVGTVENDAAETSAAIRAAMPDAAEAKSIVLGLAQSAAEEAARESDPSRRAKTLLDAAKTIAQVTGANAPTKVQVQSDDADAPWLAKEGE